MEEIEKIKKEIDAMISKINIFELIEEEKKSSVKSCNGGANIHLEPEITAWGFEEFDRPWIIEVSSKLRNWKEKEISEEKLEEIINNFRTPFELRKIAQKIRDIVNLK